MTKDAEPATPCRSREAGSFPDDDHRGEPSGRQAPGADRAAVIAEELRGQIRQGSTGMGLETSLLLTYLGRITGNQAMVDEGLADMSTRLPADDKKEAALYQLLSGVWGSKPEPTPKPAP